MGSFSGCDMKSFAVANNEFAIGLYQRASIRRRQPVPIAPTASGPHSPWPMPERAVGTAHQMAEVLRFPEGQSNLHRELRAFEDTLASYRDGDNIDIDVANALWRQKGFPLLKGFLEAMDAESRAALFEADFAGAPKKACRAINRWASDKTRGKIRDIVRPEDFCALTRLVLANAIYFSGKWKSPFDEHKTFRGFFIGGPESPCRGRRSEFP